jgi:hypothetical protein
VVDEGGVVPVVEDSVGWLGYPVAGSGADVVWSEVDGPPPVTVEAVAVAPVAATVRCGERRSRCPSAGSDHEDAAATTKRRRAAPAAANHRRARTRGV